MSTSRPNLAQWHPSQTMQAAQTQESQLQSAASIPRNIHGNPPRENLRQAILATFGASNPQKANRRKQPGKTCGNQSQSCGKQSGQELRRAIQAKPVARNAGKIYGKRSRQNLQSGQHVGQAVPAKPAALRQATQPKPRAGTIRGKNSCQHLSERGAKSAANNPGNPGKICGTLQAKPAASNPNKVRGKQSGIKSCSKQSGQNRRKGMQELATNNAGNICTENMRQATRKNFIAGSPSKTCSKKFRQNLRHPVQAKSAPRNPGKICGKQRKQNPQQAIQAQPKASNPGNICLKESRQNLQQAIRKNKQSKQKPRQAAQAKCTTNAKCAANQNASNKSRQICSKQGMLNLQQPRPKTAEHTTGAKSAANNVPRGGRGLWFSRSIDQQKQQKLKTCVFVVEQKLPKRCFFDFLKVDQDRTKPRTFAWHAYRAEHPHCLTICLAWTQRRTPPAGVLTICLAWIPC